MNAEQARSQVDAELLAHKLVKQLGDNWTPVTYEDFGWCYCARTKSDIAEVSFHEEQQCYVCNIDLTLGEKNFSWDSSHKDPRESYLLAKAKMDVALNELISQAETFISIAA